MTVVDSLRFIYYKINPYILVVLFWAIAVTSKYFFNGEMFGFDFGIYQPDGADYTYRTLVLIGHQSQEAANVVVEWYKVHSFDLKDLSTSNLIAHNSPIFEQSFSRILYPGLSTLPVLFLGVPGMLVIPAISLLIVLISCQYIAQKNNLRSLGLVLVFLVLTSPTFMRWMFVNTTDSLLTALFALLVMNDNSSLTRTKKNIITLALIILTAFTRFCLPIWVAYFFVKWMKREFFKWDSILLITSFLFTLPSILINSNNSGTLLPLETQLSLFQKIISLPIFFVKIMFVEFAELAALDRLLLLGILIALFIAIKYWENISSKLFIAIGFSVFSLGAINGVLGVNFRYQMPLMPFLFWVIISNIEAKPSA